MYFNVLITVWTRVAAVAVRSHLGLWFLGACSRGQ